MSDRLAEIKARREKITPNCWRRWIVATIRDSVREFAFEITDWPFHPHKGDAVDVPICRAKKGGRVMCDLFTVGDSLFWPLDSHITVELEAPMVFDDVEVGIADLLSVGWIERDDDAMSGPSHAPADIDWLLAEVDRLRHDNRLLREQNATLKSNARHLHIPPGTTSY